MTAAPPPKMRLDELGAYYPTRLSFTRRLCRNLAAAQAAVTRDRWHINRRGHGNAVYTVRIPHHPPVSLVAFSAALDAAQRSDRVIANRWDSAFVLYDGIPDAAAMRRLAANVPRQEAGRYTERELSLSRANKSVRFFDDTVTRLARGTQPDPTLMTRTGYLMRTTAVYGNGKFGIADRARLAAKHPFFAPPFQAELLAVWLIRLYSLDLAEHIARARAPHTAVPLSPENRRHLGIGNATGLGMAPFLVTHPVLLHNWITTRHAAHQAALAQPPTPALRTRLHTLLARARAHLTQWHTEDRRQRARLATLRRELATLHRAFPPSRPSQPHPAHSLHHLAADLSAECRQLVTALLIETTPCPDSYAAAMQDNTLQALDPTITTAELRHRLQNHYRWALTPDYAKRAHSRRFWYISAEKKEPRFGDRYREPGSDRELPLDIGRQIQNLHRALTAAAPRASLAQFLAAHPHHRHAVWRAQLRHTHPYAEIQDNLIAEDCLPIDMLRFKLSFFGASKFDPKSTLWTRIVLFQGAPLPDTLHHPDADDWWLPFHAPD